MSILTCYFGDSDWCGNVLTQAQTITEYEARGSIWHSNIICYTKCILQSLIECHCTFKDV